MKKRVIAFMLVVAMGLALTACGGNDKNKPEATPPAQQETGSNTESTTPPPSDDQSGNQNNETDKPAENDNNGAADVTSSSTPAEMLEGILAKVEQPSLMDMNADMIKDMYQFDPAIADQYAVKMPMMNTKTNEIAIFTFKDDATKAAIEAGMKKRAEAVQEQFKTYLQDQLENAKNYKIVTQDSYMLFVISEEADAIVDTFNSFFGK